VRLDVAKEAVNKRRIIHYFMEREMKISDGVQDVLYIRESHQQQNLLVIGYYALC